MPKYLLLAIIALAGFLRLFMLGSTPASLNWDEVAQGYTAYSVAQTGRDEWGERLPLAFRSYGEWKSAVYIYLLVPFIKVFGLNALAIRLPSALFGVVSVYLLYLIGRKLYSEKVGLWAAFLMAVTPWSFFLSRPAFEANVALTLVLLGIHFFLKIDLGNTRYSILNTLYSALAFGLAPHTYNSAKIVVPLLVIYLIYRARLFKRLKPTLLMLSILAIFALPLILQLFSGSTQARYNQVSLTTDGEALAQFYALRSTIPSPLDKIIVNKATFSAYQFGANYLSYFDPAFLAWRGGTHTQQSMPYHGVLYLTQFVAVIIGLLVLSKRRHPALPLVLIALGLVPAAMTRDPQHVLRSILAIPGFILLGALGIEYLQRTYSRYFKPFTVILSLEIIAFMLIYFSWYGPAYTRDWQYGYPQVTSYLEQHQDQYDHIVVTKWFGEPQLFLAFYGAWDPAKFQSENVYNLRYESEGKMWLDQLDEYSLGKYSFKYIDWKDETRKSSTLYIGKADDFYPDSRILETITYPDGSVAFLIVEGDK